MLNILHFKNNLSKLSSINGDVNMGDGLEGDDADGGKLIKFNLSFNLLRNNKHFDSFSNQ